jgi:hypothetical protein
MMASIPDVVSPVVPAEQIGALAGEKHALGGVIEEEESSERPSKRSRRSTLKSAGESSSSPAAPATTNGGNAAPKPKKKASTAEEEFDTVWICVECKEAECMLQTDADELLICEGPCARGFHFPCAGLSQLPEVHEPWICKDCSQRQHACSLCQEYGKDGEDVFKCQKDNCGLFFHEACLSMHQVEIQQIRQQPTQAKETDVEADDKYTPVFTCPSHWCWTCTQVPPKQSNEETTTNPPKKKGKKGKKKLSPLEQAFKSKTESRLFVSLCNVCPPFQLILWYLMVNCRLD